MIDQVPDTVLSEGMNQNSSELGVPITAQWLRNPTRNHEVLGSIPGLTQWAKDAELA